MRRSGSGTLSDIVVGGAGFAGLALAIALREGLGPAFAVTVTDPALDALLRAAGFEITEAGRRRWRVELARPIPQDALDDAKRLLKRFRGRAA